MKPESSNASRESKNSRLSLQVLQPAATDKENLVGGSRQPGTSMKVGLKPGEKNEKNKSNEKAHERKEKDTSKKKKVAHKHVQTENTEKITIKDLISEEASENYWRTLAEKRRVALDESLTENQLLIEKIEILQQAKEATEMLLDESRNLVEVLKEILGAEKDDEDDEKDTMKAVESTSDSESSSQ